MKTSVSMNPLKVAFTKKIAMGPGYLYWALDVLYENQTPHERRHRCTRAKNGVGFSGPDGRPLSLCAEKLRSGQKLNGAETNMVKAKISKYWRQFVTSALRVPEESVKPHRRGPQRAASAQQDKRSIA